MQNAPRTLKRPFLPYLFPRKGKDRAAGGIRQLQICYNLSVSLRLTAPLGGEPFSLRRDNPSGAPRQRRNIKQVQHPQKRLLEFSSRGIFWGES